MKLLPVAPAVDVVEKISLIKTHYPVKAKDLLYLEYKVLAGTSFDVELKVFRF